MYLSQGCYIAGTGGGICRVESHRLSAPGQNNQGPSWSTPRFSSDMVLLSRIRLSQGCLDDAMRLASKALTFRQNLLGNRLKTCDSLYDVAGLLYRQGNFASAM